LITLHDSNPLTHLPDVLLGCVDLLILDEIVDEDRWLIGVLLHVELWFEIEFRKRLRSVRRDFNLRDQRRLGSDALPPEFD